MFTNFVLLNLVTGVILENVLTISKREEEKALQKEESHRMQTVMKIHYLFDAVLGDRETDEISIEEFRHICRNPKVVRQLQNLQIAVYEAEELFFLMDTEKHGAINVDLFIEGCLRIRGAARAKHLLGVQYDVQKVWSKLALQIDEVEDRFILEMQRNSQVIAQETTESMSNVISAALKEAAAAVLPEVMLSSLKSTASEVAVEAAKIALREFSQGSAPPSTSEAPPVVAPDVHINSALPIQVQTVPSLFSALPPYAESAWTEQECKVEELMSEDLQSSEGNGKDPDTHSSQPEVKEERPDPKSSASLLSAESAKSCPRAKKQDKRTKNNGSFLSTSSATGLQKRPGALSSQRVHEAAQRLLDLRREEECLIKRVDGVQRSRHVELCLIARLLTLEETVPSQSGSETEKKQSSTGKSTKPARSEVDTSHRRKSGDSPPDRISSEGLGDAQASASTRSWRFSSEQISKQSERKGRSGSKNREAS
jgi:hypothetical protein